ncbi:MAG TPA: FtsX-like permease family protein, partial [Gaiellaceae bacterium]|nr:FtsX-like permease family protein [Gaiellaceae bacterium]
GAVDSFTRLDREVAPQLEQLTGAQPAAAMLFRESSIQGRLVNPRAANDLGRYVRLLSGRLPKPCVPSHCEVLRLQGTGPIPSTPALRLIEVGRATFKPDAPMAPFVLPAPHNIQVAQAVRYHTPQPSPIVIANGIAGLSSTKELETFYRAYAWFVPVRGGDVHPWSIDDFAAKVQRISAQLEASPDSFEVTAPTDTLATAAASSTAASRRLLLLGGEGGALLLAFTVLAAAALRRDVGDARRRLVWFGARRWQVELFTLAEAAALAALGTIAGWILGGGAAAVVASHAGSPAGQVVSHGLLSTGGLLAAVGIAVGAGLLLYAAVRAPAVQLGRLAITPLDAAALGALAVVLIGWARGSIDAQTLASARGTSAYLLLVPALIVFVAAVACARLLSPMLRALGRLGRRGPVAIRLAAASLARNPGHAAIAATFLVASVGLALFALVYRSTLVTGQHDEAKYTVPASFVLTEDLSQLVPVLHGAPASAYPAPPKPVLRLSGNVPSGATFTMLGLPTPSLADVGGWRSDFASQPLATLGKTLTPTRDETLRTTALPPGRQFALNVATQGDNVGLRAVFRSALGDYEPVTLGQTRGRRTVTLHGRIPFLHATLAQLQFYLLNGGHFSANGGIGIQPAAKGVLTLGTPTVNGRPVRKAFAGWIGVGGASGREHRAGYLITPDRVGTFRPVQPTDGHRLDVLVTPSIARDAGPNGVVPLQVEGEQIAAHVVGVIRRFPSIVGDAVIADRQTMSTLFDTRSPGLGTTDELWLDVPTSQEAATADRLERAPFTALSMSSRSTTLHRLQADPLARGALLTLAGTAIVALLLALVGLVLAIVADVRDDRGELFDLEAQGAAPATIRAHLRLRALLVAAFGIVGGIALGAILSALVIALVSVTATSAEPEPPLRLTVDGAVLAAAAAAYVVLAALLVAGATALRGRAPARAAEAAA